MAKRPQMKKSSINKEGLNEQVKKDNEVYLDNGKPRLTETEVLRVQLLLEEKKRLKIEFEELKKQFDVKSGIKDKLNVDLMHVMNDLFFLEDAIKKADAAGGSQHLKYTDYIKQLSLKYKIPEGKFGFNPDTFEIITG